MPSTAPTPSACGAFRGRCSRPRPTTPSGARMPARASRCSPIMPRPGPPPWRTGIRSCTTRRRRSTPQRCLVLLPASPRRLAGGVAARGGAGAGGLRRLRRAGAGGDAEIGPRGEREHPLGLRRHGLRGSARGLRRAGADPGRGVPRGLPPLRGAGRRRGRRPRTGAGGVEADDPRGSRRLPRCRGLGAEPRRSRQPPAARLRRPRRPARGPSARCGGLFPGDGRRTPSSRSRRGCWRCVGGCPTSSPKEATSRSRRGRAAVPSSGGGAEWRCWLSHACRGRQATPCIRTSEAGGGMSLLRRMRRTPPPWSPGRGCSVCVFVRTAP